MKKNKLRPINIVFYSKWDSFEKWRNIFINHNMNLYNWPDDFKKNSTYSNINGALVWDPPDEIWKHFPNIKMNTVPHIDIVKFIEEQILKFEPNKIFTHHPSDLNDDHVHTAMSCLPAARLFQRRLDVKPIDAIYFMEILSSTDWSFPTNKKNFEPDTFTDITETLELKLQALSMYENVVKTAPHPRSIEVLTGHASSRGGQCGYRFAEAFQVAFKRGV